MTQLRRIEYPTVDPADPWSVDRLGRRKIAEHLTPIILGINQPFVLSLESPYGTGKSVFIDCWRAQLAKDGYCTVKFNAWETDFSQTPLMAFMSCLRRAFPESTAHKAGKSVLESGKKIIRASAAKLPGLVVKALLRKALDTHTAEELLKLGELTADDLADGAQDAMDEALKAQEEAEEAIFKLRESFSNLITEIGRSTAGEQNHPEKLIVFIDDLDRCRPDYTIEFLECIKHFFAVPGAVFVLAIDAISLAASVRAGFGETIDSDNYLRKFIDWRFRLPRPATEHFSVFLAERFDFFSLAQLRRSTTRQELESAVHSFGKASQALGLTLREQEQCFTELNLALRSLPLQRNLLSPETAILTVYRCRHRQRLLDWLAGLISAERMASEMADSFASVDIFRYSNVNQRDALYALFIDEHEATKLFNMKPKDETAEGPQSRTALQIDQLLEIRRMIRIEIGPSRSLASVLLSRIEELNMA